MSQLPNLIMTNELDTYYPHSHLRANLPPLFAQRTVSFGRYYVWLFQSNVSKSHQQYIGITPFSSRHLGLIHQRLWWPKERPAWCCLSSRFITRRPGPDICRRCRPPRGCDLLVSDTTYTYRSIIVTFVPMICMIWLVCSSMAYVEEWRRVTHLGFNSAICNFNSSQ